MKILIIGYGIVGKAIGRTMRALEPCIYDPALGFSDTFSDKPFDIGFICVPTDMQKDGSADTTNVRNAIDQWSDRCGVLVIKSTVPPGFTSSFLVPGYDVVMSPEFDGATLDSWNVDSDFVIIGGFGWDADIVAEAYKKVKPSTFRILVTDSTTAELVKYAENAFLATKVAFFNEFYRICESFGVSINAWRELLLNDPRIGRSHTMVHKDHPYYDSHCLNKDVPAIISAAKSQGYRPKMLEQVVKSNAAWKREAKR